jgi:hypothetical protein
LAQRVNVPASAQSTEAASQSRVHTAPALPPAVSEHTSSPHSVVELQRSPKPGFPHAINATTATRIIRIGAPYFRR